jgi:hypothetical protein
MLLYFVVNAFGKKICGPFRNRDAAQIWAEKYTYARGYACFVYEYEKKGDGEK